MTFDGISFIKADIPFVAEHAPTSPAPMFRKSFTLGKVGKAELSICALGFGYCWINGQIVSGDIMMAAASDYNKTLWYNVYDVSGLLREGENTIAVICGNGWYNEPFKTPWDHNIATWRDNPKFIMSLTMDGERVLTSDDSWRCLTKTPIIYNQLRSGEHFDSRLYDKQWNDQGFDDSAWGRAIADTTLPKGQFRKYECQSVRECAQYPAKSVVKTGEKRYLFDIGQNISGYVRLKVKQKAGDELIIRYVEQVKDDLTLEFNDMKRFYPESEFQTDRFICNGEDFTWSPLFAYHGFRYVEIEGLEDADVAMVTGIFIHLDVETLSGFSCSDEFLNRLFYIGQMATLSNLHYIPTDCPTREKLGWANDAQASAEQMLMDFDTVPFFRKWLVDVIDSITEEGAIPGIIPSSGWGYKWGTGPVSSGVLFEVPYKIYLYTGDDSALISSLPAFMHHLDFLTGKIEDDGLLGFGLCDWAGPFETLSAAPTPVKFTDSLLYIKFLRIAELAAKRAGDKDLEKALAERTQAFTANFMNVYIDGEGYCTVDEQTAVSMLIYHGIYKQLKPLKKQLKRLVQERDFHHNCGMVGLRHLYHALNICGLQEYAYRVITASGYPSYRQWVEGDATTLWETWQPGNSKNHHMYSDYMLWMMNTLVGICPDMGKPGFDHVRIAPYFAPELTRCSGYRLLPGGKLQVEWERTAGKVSVVVQVPQGVQVYWQDEILAAGEHSFMMED